MSVRQYLPSTQFITIVGALAISGGIVYAAQYITGRPQGAQLAATTSNVPSQEDWQKTLEEIQLNSGISLPEAPDQALVSELVAGVQSNNLTDSVARSLFIKLTNAKAQGLGDDIPTQEELIAEANASIQAEASAKMYTKADLTSVAQNNDSLRTYGNKVMTTFALHPKASASTVLVAVGQAVDYNDAKYVSGLSAAQAEYMALADDLAALPVPSTLIPLHLQLVQDIARMWSAVGDLRVIVGDPLRGLAGLSNFQAAGDEATRVLTTIAGTLRKSGILFSKDEPGASWSAFVSGT